MKKNEFVKLVADKAAMSQKDVATVMEAFETVMLENVIAVEDSVRLGLGTFSGVTKAARAGRTGRNPRTGEPVEIAAVPEKHGQPHVKWSKAARE